MATTKRQKADKGSGLADRLFRDHPRAVGMTWAGHCAGAVKVGLQLIGAGLAAIVHGAVPAVFPDTASRTVIRVHDHIRKLNAKRADDA